MPNLTIKNLTVKDIYYLCNCVSDLNDIKIDIKLLDGIIDSLSGDELTELRAYRKGQR